MFKRGRMQKAIFAGTVLKSLIRIGDWQIDMPPSMLTGLAHYFYPPPG